MKAKTIDNSPHGWDTCIYDNEDCPMGYYVDDLPDKERADKYTNIFNLELSSHVAKETEKLQAEIDYIKREKLALNLLIDEITDGDCLKQSKAKLSAEIKELKAEVQKVDYAYRNMTRRYRKAIDKMEAQNKNVTNLQQTISQLNKMYNQAINDLTISQEKVERLEVIKWINVEERLPECDGIFLVCTIAGDVDMIEFNNGAFGVEHQNIFIPARQGLITHWQPLPQPTK